MTFTHSFAYELTDEEKRALADAAAVINDLAMSGHADDIVAPYLEEYRDTFSELLEDDSRDTLFSVKLLLDIILDNSKKS